MVVVLVSVIEDPSAGVVEVVVSTVDVKPGPFVTLVALTHSPAPLFAALLHSPCTGKVPVDRLMFSISPGPEDIHWHLSASSFPRESSQPLPAIGSVTVSANS